MGSRTVDGRMTAWCARGKGPVDDLGGEVSGRCEGVSSSSRRGWGAHSRESSL